MITLEKCLWGGAIGGLALTIPLAGILPQWAKTAGLAASFFSSAGLVALESVAKDWKKYQLAQRQIDQGAIESRYSSVDAINQAASELQYQIALKAWIIANVPIEAWEYSFATHGLTAIALTEIHAAREAMGLVPPPIIELEAEVIPKPQTTQGSVVDAVMKQVQDGLDTEWFEQWGRRSGIVAGESGDGKSWLLSNIVLARFIKENTDPETGFLKGKIYICDPDYGSSHEGSEPNTWLDLPVGEVVYFKMKDIYNVVMYVSREVNRRAEETAERREKKLDRLNYEPILLIVDEEPMIAASIDAMEGDLLSDFVLAIANILRRGLKQGNCTFKMGSQTLAVGAKGKGGTRLNMDMLRQVEMVILWRAAQVKENYTNLGISRPEIIEDVLKQVLPLPRRMGSKFVCVTYLDKQLQIAAIPEVKAVQVEPVSTQQDSVNSAPIADLYQHLLQWQQQSPDASDDRLLAEFKRLTGRQLNAEGLQSLKELLDRMRGAA